VEFGHIAKLSATKDGLHVTGCFKEGAVSENSGKHLPHLILASRALYGPAVFKALDTEPTLFRT